MTKTLLLGILSIACFILLLNLAYAQKIQFSDIDVKVGGKSDNNLKNGETIGKDAAPEDKIEFKIETKNNYTLSSDPDIENIVVTVTINSIDGEDGDDLEEESADFDLSPGKDKSKTLSFKLPLEIEEGSYTVEIVADGKDENGTTQKVTAKLTLEVEKERHQIKINRNSVSPAEVSCIRNGIAHTVGIINIGQEDEENVILSVSNSNLGISSQESVLELPADTFEDESKYVKTFTYNIPADVPAGTYPTTIKVSYGSNSETATANLVVNDCAKKAADESKVEEKKPAVKEEEKQEEEVEVITPTTTPPLVITPPTTVPQQEPEITAEPSILSNKFVVGSIIAVEVIAVIAGIALVVYLARKR